MRTKKEIGADIASSQKWIRSLKARTGADPNSIIKHQALIVKLHAELAALRDSDPTTG